MRNLFILSVRAARRLGGFSVSVALMAVASLALVPATIGAAGLENWSSIVLAQALALVLQVVAGCGYGVNGPAIVAMRTPEDGVEYFRVAQRTRFVVIVPCLVLMIAAMFIIPNPDPVAGLFGSAYLAIGTFSALFFYIGRAAPLWFLLAETAPRVSFIFAGAISLSLGAPLLVGLALPAIGAALAVAISNVTIYRSSKRTPSETTRLRIADVRAELRIQLGPTAVTVLQGGRDALPVLMVAAVAGELVGPYGVFDRVQRQAVMTLGPVIATLQGWVPRRIAAEASARPAITAILAGFAGIPVVILVLTLLGPTLIGWLSAGTLSPTFIQTLLFAIVVATNMLMSIILYACLVPLGGTREVILSSLTGVIGIVLAISVLSSLERSLTYLLGALVFGNVIQIAVQLMLMNYTIAKSKFPRVD